MRIVLIAAAAFGLLAFATTANAQVIDPCCTINASQSEHSDDLPVATASVNEVVIEPTERPAGTAEPVASDDSEGFSLSGSAAAESAQLFPDQSYKASGKGFFSGSIDGTYKNLCAGVWGGQAGSSWEVDLTACAKAQLGKAAITFQVGHYLVPGKDINEAKVSIELPLNDSCSLTLSAEVMRGGFDDTVAKASADCSTPIVGKLSLDYSAAIAYSDWAGRGSIPLHLGLTYELKNGTTVSGYLDGYLAEESAVIVGASTSWKFW